MQLPRVSSVAHVTCQAVGGVPSPVRGRRATCAASVRHRPNPRPREDSGGGRRLTRLDVDSQPSLHAGDAQRRPAACEVRCSGRAGPGTEGRTPPTAAMVQPAWWEPAARRTRRRRWPGRAPPPPRRGQPLTGDRSGEPPPARRGAQRPDGGRPSGHRRPRRHGRRHQGRRGLAVVFPELRPARTTLGAQIPASIEVDAVFRVRG